MNKLLMEENDRLQKQVSHLVSENGYMKQQLTLTTVVCTHTNLWFVWYLQSSDVNSGVCGFSGD